MLKIWGRNDGSNVVKVMWCVGELGVEFERMDWGGPFGGNDEPEYRRKNPNGRVPTLEEDDGFTLWESGAVVRYLCAKYSMGNLCPEDLRERASADKWMDWSILDRHLADNAYLGGDRLTIADFPAGSLLHRWMQWTPNRPAHPNVEAYYERLIARPAYQEHVIEANALRTGQIQKN